jgi:hypothetical protein
MYQCPGVCAKCVCTCVWFVCLCAALLPTLVPPIHSREARGLCQGASGQFAKCHMCTGPKHTICAALGCAWGAGWVCPTPWAQDVHLRCSGECKKAVLVEADWAYRGDNVNSSCANLSDQIAPNISRKFSTIVYLWSMELSISRSQRASNGTQKFIESAA